MFEAFYLQFSRYDRGKTLKCLKILTAPSPTKGGRNAQGKGKGTIEGA